MKASFALLVVIASLGKVSAYPGNRNEAPKLTAPRPVDNSCDDKQKRGWTWEDLDVGHFSEYHGWDFSGWACREDRSRRDGGSRTPRKTIYGECGSSLEETPFFGRSTGKRGGACDTFSVKKFHIKPEFDCRLEFHYEMPDGSSCKHQADCFKSGTDVYNSQCGGAKKAYIVYPKQPNKLKEHCRIEMPRIEFNCEKTETSKICTGCKRTAPSPGGETRTSPSGGYNKGVLAGDDDTQTHPGSDVVNITSIDEQTTRLPSNKAATTRVKVITSCSSQVSSCLATADTDSPTVIIKTVAAPATIYTVDETQIQKSPEPIHSRLGNGELEGASEYSKPARGSYNVLGIVSSCLNTFLESVEGCHGNNDAACYCPNKEFVDNVFQCLHAHAKADGIIVGAVSFFQGICAPYVEQNPGITASADSVTGYISITGITAIASDHYTTAAVVTTVIEPYVHKRASLQSSGRARAIVTNIIVPEISFTSNPTSSGPVSAVPPAPTAIHDPGTTTAGEILITDTLPADISGILMPTAVAPGSVPATAGAVRTGIEFARAILVIFISMYGL